MNSTKIFRFGQDVLNGREEQVIIIKELLDPAYGCYVWPSAFVLSEYIWAQKDLFRDKTILEIGAGTSLPGFLCASLSPETHVILTDRPDVPQILENIREGARLNGLMSSAENRKAEEDDDKPLRQNVWVRGLKWGEIFFQCDDDREEGLLKLLRDIEQSGKQLDWILGSDTFYDPKDFEDIIVTIAYILTHHSPNAKFITSYQERSSKRSIQYLLDKWKLESRQISLESFNFDYNKYTTNLSPSSSDDEEESINAESESMDISEDDDLDSLEEEDLLTGHKDEAAYSASLHSIFLIEIWKPH
ncbi:2004_t:CDS:2 [Acaulospora morrowiae]|uniref:2004_t:CDS:1 n=1 Tax=Acaulospora morrowiae TaxID=94023 RepID=A0A9N8WJU4_9GLOM|nr:2004_t:CDS:2 [Acaulospora morrowiae]